MQASKIIQWLPINSRVALIFMLLMLLYPTQRVVECKLLLTRLSVCQSCFLSYENTQFLQYNVRIYSYNVVRKVIKCRCAHLPVFFINLFLTVFTLKMISAFNVKLCCFSTHRRSKTTEDTFARTSTQYIILECNCIEPLYYIHTHKRKMTTFLNI